MGAQARGKGAAWDECDACDAWDNVFRRVAWGLWAAMESALRLADGFAYVGASHSLGIIGGKNSHAMAEIGVKFVQRRRGLVQPKFGSWADFFLTQRRSGAEKYSVLHGFCRREEELGMRE